MSAVLVSETPITEDMSFWLPSRTARDLPRKESDREKPSDMTADRFTGLPEGVAEALRRLEEQIRSSVLVLRANNYPTEENVAAATAWCPEAASMLKDWSESWSRSFPEHSLDEAVRSHVNEGPSDWHVLRRSNLLDRESKAVVRGDIADLAVHRFRVMVDEVAGSRSPRPWQAHVVDDAEIFRALRQATPGDTFVLLGTRMFRLDGHDDDGLPIISSVTRESFVSSIVKSKAQEDDEPYWRLEAFTRHAGRALVGDLSREQAALTLLAMAQAGHSKAFLKGVQSKSGTWTVDLSRVSDPLDAIAEMARVMGIHAWPKGGVIVQEHVPFRAEQRFFVMDGRVVASVCSDRESVSVHASRSRLDDRVAVLRVPEIDKGEYDRGATIALRDRKLAAAFARKARAVVRDMRQSGAMMDYVLDIGIGMDGEVRAIETNSLFMAGPYCLDRTWMVEARRRARNGALATIAELTRLRYRSRLDEVGRYVDVVLSSVGSLLSFARMVRGNPEGNERHWRLDRRTTKVPLIDPTTFGARLDQWTRPSSRTNSLGAGFRLGKDESRDMAVLSMFPGAVPLCALSTTWSGERQAHLLLALVPHGGAPNEFVMVVGVVWDEGPSPCRRLAPISYRKRAPGYSNRSEPGEEFSLSEEMGLSGGPDRDGFVLFSHPEVGTLRIVHVPGELRLTREYPGRGVIGFTSIVLPENVEPVIAEVGSIGSAFHVRWKTELRRGSGRSSPGGLPGRWYSTGTFESVDYDAEVDCFVSLLERED